MRAESVGRRRLGTAPQRGCGGWLRCPAHSPPTAICLPICLPKMVKAPKPLEFRGLLECEEGDLNPHDVTR